MARQAHHHYIPALYLKRFTNEGNNKSKFYCVPTDGRKPYPTNPRDSCSKRDYYCTYENDALSVEKLYAEKIEPKFESVLENLCKLEDITSISNRKDLHVLLASLYIRPPDQRENSRLIRQRIKDIATNISANIPVSNLSEFDFTEKDLIIDELNDVLTCSELFEGTYFRLLSAKQCKSKFITSDRPFTLDNPALRKGIPIGLNTPDTTIIVPLSKDLVLTATNESTPEETINVDEKMVGVINNRVALRSSQYYSADPQVTFCNEYGHPYIYDLSL